jgi:hypothetical protein
LGKYRAPGKDASKHAPGAFDEGSRGDHRFALYASFKPRNLSARQANRLRLANHLNR